MRPVAMNLGAVQFAVMFQRPTSRARYRVYITTPAFATPEPPDLSK